MSWRTENERNTDDLTRRTKNMNLGGGGGDSNNNNRYVPPSRRGDSRGADLGFELPSSTSRLAGSAGGFGGAPARESSGYGRGTDRTSTYGGRSERGYGRGSGGGYRGGRDSGFGGGRSGSGMYGGGRQDGRFSSRDDSTIHAAPPSQMSNDCSAVPGEFEWLPRNSAIEKRLFGEKVHTGINFDKYDDIPSSVSGDNCPKPIATFEESGLHPLIKDNIKIAGYTNPTPVQKYSVSTVLAGRDLMACAQTGSGKTAAFLVPILDHIFKTQSLQRNKFFSRAASPVGLIIAPTRELAIQIFEEACKFAYRSWVRPCVAYGGAPIGEQLREIQKGCDLMVATPGRLSDLIGRGRVSLAQCTFLVLDEADRMLDMGFEPQIREIVDGTDMLPVKDRQTLMYSATFPREIQMLAGDFMKDYVFLSVGRVGSTSENITQVIEHIEEFDKRDRLMSILKSSGPLGLTLVFVETKRNADALDDYIYRQGISSTSIHGDRTQVQREAALKAFKCGECPVIVATAVAARGLDIPNVAQVINYDLPTDIDDYVHRIGRTGRAGNTGKAISFYNGKNENIKKGLLELLQEAKQVVPDFLKGGSFGGGGRPVFTGRGVSYGGGRGSSRGGFRGGGGSRYGGSDHRSTAQWGSHDRHANSNPDFSRGGGDTHSSGMGRSSRFV